MRELRNRVVQVSHFGGPEGLEVVDTSLPTAGRGEVRVRVLASSLNYTDVPLGKPFIDRRRKQKPRRAVKLPEIAHQAHPAGESIAPSYPMRHVIR